MIDVKPLSDFKFAVSEFNRDAIVKALEQIKNFPRMTQIVVHNKTKSVNVGCSMQGSELHIFVTNPQDEEFNVNG